MLPTSFLLAYKKPLILGLFLALGVFWLAGPTAWAQGSGDSLRPVTADLALGDRGPAVRDLQKLLNQVPGLTVSDTGPGSPGRETEYFGPLTRRAVVAFQERYAGEVLAPWGLMRGTGFVGRTTREKLNSFTTDTATDGASAEELRRRIAELQARIEALSSQNASGQPGAGEEDDGDLFLPGEEDPAEVGGRHRLPRPVILDLDPEEGPDGTRVTITGRNFALEDNTVLISLSSVENYPVVSSNDGEELSFRLETDITHEIADQLEDASDDEIERVKETFPAEIPIQLKVRNFLGESNTASFTLTPFSDL